MAGQQQQQSGGDNSLSPLWITAGLFIFGWIIWIYARAYIAAFILKVKLVEARSLNIITGKKSKDGIKMTENVNQKDLRKILKLAMIAAGAFFFSKTMMGRTYAKAVVIRALTIKLI